MKTVVFLFDLFLLFEFIKTEELSITNKLEEVENMIKSIDQKTDDNGNILSLSEDQKKAIANVDAILIIDIYSDLKDLLPSKCGKKFNTAGEVMVNFWNKGKDLRSRCVTAYIKEARLNWGVRYDHRKQVIDTFMDQKTLTDEILKKEFFLSEKIAINGDDEKFKTKALLFTDLYFTFCIDGKPSQAQENLFKSNFSKFYSDYKSENKNAVENCIKIQQDKLANEKLLERYEEFLDNNTKIVKKLRENYIQKEIDAACQKDSKCSEFEKPEEKTECLSRCQDEGENSSKAFVEMMEEIISECADFPRGKTPYVEIRDKILLKSNDCFLKAYKAYKADLTAFLNSSYLRISLALLTLMFFLLN